MDEQQVQARAVATYHPPLSDPPPKAIHWVYNAADGSVLRDHNGRPVSVDKLLATKPLKGELSSRPGPGGKKLTYLSGEGVTRTLNDIFGYDGWNLDISRVQREECLKDDNGRYTVVYTAMVRLTHKASGAYKEDCGAGDSTDRAFGTAVANALKASITDGLKRAARHFGDKLGNSLYAGNFSISKAPVTLKEALDRYDIDRANTKFGFPKDQKLQASNSEITSKPQTRTVGGSASLVVAQPSVAQSNGWQRSPPGATSASEPCILPVQNKTTVKLEEHRLLPKDHTKAAPAKEIEGISLKVETAFNHGAVDNKIAATSSARTALCAPPPPPTPMDALRHSALFAPSDGHFDAITLDASPMSSHGRATKSTSSRLSIGDGRPVAPPPLVTPASSTSGKRGPLPSDSNLEHQSLPKKQHQSNPYSTNTNQLYRAQGQART